MPERDREYADARLARMGPEGATAHRVFSHAQSVEDAVDILSSAAALGIQPPAIAGTTVFEAEIVSDVTEKLGLYMSQQAAEAAVARWVMEQFHVRDGVGLAPWQEDEASERTAQAWAAARSDRQIVEAYFVDSDLTVDHIGWRLRERTVQTWPPGYRA